MKTFIIDVAIASTLIAITLAPAAMAQSDTGETARAQIAHANAELNPS